MSFCKSLFSLFVLLIIFTSCEEINNLKHRSWYEKDSITDTPSPSLSFNKKYHEGQFDDRLKLYYFIRTWGLLKYKAPEVSNGRKNWDKELIQRIPKVLASKTINEFSNNIQSLLDLSEIQDSVLNSGDDQNKFWYQNSYFSKHQQRNLNWLYEKSVSNIYYVTQKGSGRLILEQSGIDNNIQSIEVRIFALAEYWNLIEYFYPYKHLLDKSWDSILYDHVLSFKEAKQELDYHLLCLQLCSEISDGHSVTTSEVLDYKFLGEYVPDFKLKYINDTLIVSQKYNNNNLIQKGDIILSMNGENLITKRNSLKVYYKNSSNQNRLDYTLNSVTISSKLKQNKLTILRGDRLIAIPYTFTSFTRTAEYKLDFYSSYEKESVSELLNPRLGYMHINKIFKSNWDDSYQDIVKCDTLIIDVRGYPNEMLFDISNKILPGERDFFKVRYADLFRPGQFRIGDGFKIGEQNKPEDFNGVLILLVDEATQSQSEFLVMALQMYPRCLTIGTQTSGSDGNIAKIRLPGGINTVMTSIGILYPDGKETQRVGVSLDHEIIPSLNDLRSKEDYLIKFVKTGRWFQGNRIEN
ncbi:MAG: hypothetical protein JKY48_03405 [Flavobacteriales bacterium]|nr:hypothetical protein [Flavobacteriales bacterium]